MSSESGYRFRVRKCVRQQDGAIIHGRALLYKKRPCARKSRRASLFLKSGNCRIFIPGSGANILYNFYRIYIGL
ncbi:hypothetical protein F9L02_06030 [Brucella intermedia]|nr:hypothetical protein F9L02_06030 [Brucella intermedia]